MNNFEKIKNMSIDELEHILCEKSDCMFCQFTYGKNLDIDFDIHICHNSKDSIIGKRLESEVK